MLEIDNIKAGNYYLFESLSSSNSVFFKTEEEIIVFKKLLKRYLGKVFDIHRIFIDKNGYQILVRIRQRRTLLSNYISECKEKGKAFRIDFIKEPWRIISEKMRIFKSLYVRLVNRKRGREGVLVKHRFKKYVFKSKMEYEQYIKDMENGKVIESQREKRYSNGKSMVKNWRVYRAREWSGRAVIKGFADLVVFDLIKKTISTHFNQPSSKFP